MEFETIKAERFGAVERLTLNRPDVLNSFNRVMAEELRAALETAASSGSVRAVLLTGAGRAFCAGQDLADFSLDDELELERVVRERYNPIIQLLRNLDKPVVCAVNGIAAGAGANLALACDIVFASEQAAFIQGFGKIGLVPDSGGSWLLPRLVGLPRAAALLLLNEKLPAAEAAAMGLIYKVLPADKFEQESLAAAESLAAQATRALGLTKRLLRESMCSSLADQLELEADLQGAAGRSEDFREGVKAFLEKRAPNFRGR